jgi:two-component system, chemotaxis family, chemotaxis protein CheY
VARVTVVNDNPEFLDLVGDILKDERYAVTLVDGGDPKPLERIRDSRPDLLMIDLRLGSDKLHGWEIAQQVRHDPALSEVPILLASADLVALAEVEDHLDDTHLTAVLTKPFEIEQLTATVERLLGEATAR